jgi:hypothetical protein
MAVTRKQEKQGEARMQRSADLKATVAADMAKLKGYSRSDVTDDKTRGHMSPLGGSKKSKEPGR